MLMVQQCAGQRGQRPAQAEIALGNKGLDGKVGLAAQSLPSAMLLSLTPAGRMTLESEPTAAAA